ncbi:response regulator transcription factor [Fundicoccus culcitae]|uniref:Heme response regulator HssR n=1 Tax=Fundicoccus culcitae TaxID=2969821 RepID=A0ABY5P9B6_9LACT|nr:response regulator transcription factor [Fundicoccus culcitae]UUX35346.1 response regulator transcription factor [Fundicoccus culcitae]
MNDILVVDDNKHTQQLMTAILEAEQFNVVIANDGQEALDILETQHIDLAIIDIMMPNMDGYELTQTLREAQNTLPILMISAKQLPADKKQGFLVGIDDYMTKPVNDEEMILRIRALLRRAKIASDRQLTIGNVVLDLDTLSVTKGDEVQVLPQKEFQLLFKLLSYPGKIFTRIQLMDEIWGMDSETGWETVTVHIARLRKRFEDWDEIEIESVRGLGYRAVKKQ